MAIVILLLLVALLATYITLLAHNLRRSKAVQIIFIGVDIAFISVAYWLTSNPESDFFLFYYLPIFAAAEYLTTKQTFAVCLGCAAALLAVVFRMPQVTSLPLTSNDLLLRVFIPRGIFFLAFVTTSAFVFGLLSRRRAELRKLNESLHTISAAAALNVMALDRAMNEILSELTGRLRFEFATISLVDGNRGWVEAARGRNVPPGWIRRSKHRLDSPDIQAVIVKTRAHKVTEGWNDCFDKTIYERFGHSRYARIFAPIIAPDDGRVVGTIEAGCKTERKVELINDSTIAEILRLGREKGGDIARFRPHKLVEMIADSAIGLIGADSAAIHVYRSSTRPLSPDNGHPWGELILAAGAGKANREYIEEFRPRASGRGQAAIDSGTPQYVNDPEQVRREYPKLFSLGIRTLAVMPLKLGSDIKGVLGVHSWHTVHPFTQRELELAMTFADQMSVTIQNHLLLSSATESVGRSWALSSLESLMESLTSPFRLPDVLKNVAKNALLSFDADSVALYQYVDGNFLDDLAVTEGHFGKKDDSLIAQTGTDDIRLQIIKAGKSQRTIGLDSFAVRESRPAQYLF
jgi:GAF domain-containing protein